MVIEFDKISSHSPIWVFLSNKTLGSLLVKKIKYAKSQLKKYEINNAAEKYLKLLRDV